MEDCPLCDLVAGNVVTKLYYQDEKVMIVDCKTCGTPMVVVKDTVNLFVINLVD